MCINCFREFEHDDLAFKESTVYYQLNYRIDLLLMPDYIHCISSVKHMKPLSNRLYMLRAIFKAEFRCDKYLLTCEYCTECFKRLEKLI